MRLLQSAVRWIYPAECSGCDELLAEEFGFCGKCWSELGVIMGLICDLCGAPLEGHSDEKHEKCDACISHLRPWRRGVSALRYGGKTRNLILAFKYGDRIEIARSFGGLLERKLSELEVVDPLLVPIPLFWRRRLSRRYNQAALLTQELGKRSGKDFLLDALVRTKATPILKDMNDSDRFDALCDAIEVRARAIPRVKARSVVLVDDVFTSGATLTSATNALLSVGVKEVYVLALARAVKNA